VTPATPSLLARVPEEARTVLLVGFEMHPAAVALAARTHLDVCCIEWYDNAIADARDLYPQVIPIALTELAPSFLVHHGYDCIVITHLRGLSVALPQALEMLAQWLEPSGDILFSVANPAYGPYSIIEHCQIGFDPVEVFDFAADAGLRLTARWPVVDPKLRDTRIDDTGHVTLFGERYRVESSEMLEDLIALEHQYAAVRMPAPQAAASPHG
jgi:hypothetical protein